MPIINHAKKHPVIFASIITLIWLILLVVPTGIISSIYKRSYDDPIISLIMRLVITTGVVLLLWRLHWLKESGVTRKGRWQIWFFALAGLIYFIPAGLYSFFGNGTFQFSNLALLPESRTVIISQLVVAVCEEVFFRGLILCLFVSVWGNTTRGLIASVVVTSLLFAIPHILQAFSLDISSLLLLILETAIISFWWGALVLSGESIWPVVVIHFIYNAVMGIQGLSQPIIEPAVIAYRNLFLFSLPLCALGIGLIIWARKTRKTGYSN